jgi:hypothetical protein
VTTDPRVAGLGEFVTPTLEKVERRRWQLWGLAIFMFFGLALGMVMLSFPEARLVVTRYVPFYMVRVFFVGLAIAFGLYLVGEESRLRLVTRRLVEEKVLSAALSNRLKELSVLFEVGKAINEVLDLDDVLRLILNSAVDLLDAEEGSIMLLDPTGEELVISCAASLSDFVAEGLRLKVGRGVAGWVAEHKEPLLINGKAEEGFFEGLERKQRKIQSAVCVPLTAAASCTGCSTSTT